MAHPLVVGRLRGTRLSETPPPNPLPLSRSTLPSPAISLYPIRDRSDLEWKARVDEASNIYRVHHHSGWTYVAHYAQHMFHLQHDTQRIIAE
jgi:hypothetical protein